MQILKSRIFRKQMSRTGSPDSSSWPQMSDRHANRSIIDVMFYIPKLCIPFYLQASFITRTFTLLLFYYPNKHASYEFKKFAARTRHCPSTRFINVHSSGFRHYFVGHLYNSKFKAVFNNMGLQRVFICNKKSQKF